MDVRQEVPIMACAVSAFICRGSDDTGGVLLLRRTGPTLAGEWCQVAGKIEAGETAWQAALREIREETGLVPDRFYSADVCEQYYDAERECVHIIPVFVALIDSAQSVTLNEEHSDYRWVSFREAEELLRFAGQRAVLRHVNSEFMQREPNELLRIAAGPDGCQPLGPMGRQ